MRWFRGLGAAMVLGIAVAFVVPGAARADQPSCSFSAPGQSDVLSTSSVTVEGVCSMNNGGTLVGDIRLSLDGPSGYKETSQPAGNAGSAGFSWTVDLDHNGTYQVAVQASGRDSSRDDDIESGSKPLSFSVEVIPSPPKGLKATVDDSTRVVSLTWTNNPEPDLTGYKVFRTVGNGNFQSVATVTTASWTDTSTSNAGGEYRYRVVAVREGSRAGTSVSSDPSGSVEASVPDPPTPTTAPTGGGDGGGGGGGGGTTDSTAPGGGTSVPGSTPGGGGGTAASPNRPGVDLSNFASLLNRARQAPASSARPLELDGGFDDTLPFQPPTTIEVEPGGEVAIDSLADSDIPVVGTDTRSSLRIFALGLLVTVLFMHVMFIKGQVAAADRLEALQLEQAGAVGD